MSNRKVAFAVLLLVAQCAVGEEYIDIGDPAFENPRTDGSARSWKVKAPWRFDAGEGINGSGGLVWENDDTNVYVCAAQGVKLETGRRYRFEASVRLEGFCPAHRHGASMGIEWCGDAGKYIGGTYAQSALSPNGKWLKLSSVTEKIPAAALSARVVLIVTPGCTGKVVFDNVSVAAVSENPVAGVYSDAYRDVADGGMVTFYAALSLPCGLDVDDVEAHFAYRRADGSILRVPSTCLAKTEAVVKLRVADMAMGKSLVGCELRRKNGEALGRAGCAFERVGEMPKRKVWIDRHRRVIVDGKPFFPFGMYYGSVTADPAELELYAKGPFNCVLPYKGQDDRKALDMLHTKGLMMIKAAAQRWWNSPRGVRKGYKSEEDADRVFIAEMDALKNHPAFLGYNTADESPLTYLPGEKHIYELIRRYDPDHPAWSVCAMFEQVRDFMPAYDAVGTDPYPVSRWPMRRETDGVTAAMRGTFGSRSVWQVVQAINWGWESSFRKNAERYHFPTEQEFRSMFWQDIIGGANGLICFYFPKMRSHAENFEENWTALCRAGEEVRRMMPVILSVEDAPSVVGVPDSLVVRTWMHEGFLYIAAAEIDEKPIKAVLKLSRGKWELQGAEIGPEQRMSAPDAVAIDLPALGVSVVKLKPDGD